MVLTTPGEAQQAGGHVAVPALVPPRSPGVSVQACVSVRVCVGVPGRENLRAGAGLLLGLAFLSGGFLPIPAPPLLSFELIQSF